MVAFELGDLEIPSFDIGVVAPDGSEITLSTDPYLITVQSVGLDEGGTSAPSGVRSASR